MRRGTLAAVAALAMFLAGGLPAGAAPARAETPARSTAVGAVAIVHPELADPRVATTGPMVNPAVGLPGACTSQNGVTVAVDLQDLPPHKIIVRCYEGRGTGYDAMIGAGFTLEGTKHDGPGFVCRISGRPSSSETISIPGNPGYRETCGPTPPAAAYWSYWHAPNGGKWEYSQWGIMNRKVIPGGFEGWSFSHNATAETNPAPRVQPSRPLPGGRVPTPPRQTPTPRPTSNDPHEQAPDVPLPAPAPPPAPAPEAPQPGDPAPPAPPAQTGAAPTTGETPATSADPTASAPATASTVPPPVARTAATEVEMEGEGGDRVVVSSEIPPPPEEEKGTSVGPWIGGGLVLLLAVLGGVFAWRRRTHV